ncbi:cytochrome b5 [Apiospora phragmitis]|uniref:Cytochrome b5 n=1 Tax=Apiospora phragmitis TaxID=2905665 RepID=A0ABR1TNJ7_9PEZI
MEDPSAVIRETQPNFVNQTSSCTAKNNNIPGATNVPGGSSEGEKPEEEKLRAYTVQEVTEQKSGKRPLDHNRQRHLRLMRGVAGKDATKKFEKHHRRGILEPYKPTYQVGVLAAAVSPPSRGSWDQADAVVLKRKGGLLGKLWK